MVLCTSRTLLKGKNSGDMPIPHVQFEDESGASNSSSSDSCLNSSHSTSSLLLDEGSSIDKLVWPSRREDCEWLADKVPMQVLVGSGCPKPCRMHRPSQKKSSKKRITKSLRTIASNGAKRKTVAERTRQPLRDITVTNLNGASATPFRPARTIPMGWHRALTNIVSQAGKEPNGRAVAD